jgi:hypothetical protein
VIALLRTQVEELSQQVVDRNKEISELCLFMLLPEKILYLTILRPSQPTSCFASWESSTDSTRRAEKGARGKEEIHEA